MALDLLVDLDHYPMSSGTHIHKPQPSPTPPVQASPLSPRPWAAEVEAAGSESHSSSSHGPNSSNDPQRGHHLGQFSFVSPSSLQASPTQDPTSEHQTDTPLSERILSFAAPTNPLQRQPQSKPPTVIQELSQRIQRQEEEETETETDDTDAPPALTPRGEAITDLLQNFQSITVIVPIVMPAAEPDAEATEDTEATEDQADQTDQATTDDQEATEAEETPTEPTTTETQIEIPYWNNRYVKEVDGQTLEPPAGFDPIARDTTLATLGINPNGAVAAGKGSPEQIKDIVERAIAEELIPTPTGITENDESLWAEAWRSPIESWLLRVGIGLDCSGFVYRALHAVVDQTGAGTIGDVPGFDNGALDVYPNIGSGSTLASDEAMGTELGEEVDAPGDLQVGDTMYITSHIRIIVQVVRSGDGIVEFTTAESTVDSRFSDGNQNGPRLHYWKYDGGDLYQRYEASEEWLLSGEDPVYRRHLAPADPAEEGTVQSKPIQDAAPPSIQAQFTEEHHQAPDLGSEISPALTDQIQRQEEEGAGAVVDNTNGGEDFDSLLETIDQILTQRSSDQTQEALLAELHPPVTALVEWCRTHLPDQEQLASFMRSTARQELKVQQLGAIANELTRMEFMLGGLYNGAAGGTPWSTDESSASLFTNTYLNTAGGLSPGQDWCTSFAGFSFGQMGAGSGTTNQLGSGPKQREGGAVVFSQDAWTILEAALGVYAHYEAAQTRYSSEAVLIGGYMLNASSVIAELDEIPSTANAERGALEQELHNRGKGRLAGLVDSRADIAASWPRPGDLLILNTQGPAQGSNDDHTAMVDRFTFPTLSTLEGNLGDATGTRELDVTDPGQRSQIYFISRPAQQMVDEYQAPATESEAETGDANAGQTVRAEVRNHNQRLHGVFVKLLPEGNSPGNYTDPVHDWSQTEDS